MSSSKTRFWKKLCQYWSNSKSFYFGEDGPFSFLFHFIVLSWWFYNFWPWLESSYFFLNFPDLATFFFLVLNFMNTSKICVIWQRWHKTIELNLWTTILYHLCDILSISVWSMAYWKLYYCLAIFIESIKNSFTTLYW